MFKKNDLVELSISDLASGGVGIAKINTQEGDLTVFVENAIPGQKVLARVIKAAKRYVECKLIEVLRSSELEITLPYQPIPGAPYATVPVNLQIEWKKRNTLELFRRIGKIDYIETLFDEFITSPFNWHYRNKMEYSFSAIRYDRQSKKEKNEPALGFKHRGTWWMVENLDKESGMFDAQLESSLVGFRKWCIASGLPFWHPPQRQGFFRYLVARKSFLDDEILLNLVTTDHDEDRFQPDAFTEFFKLILGKRLAGIIHTINNETADRADPLEGSTRLLFGKPIIKERMNGLDFEISMKSFFQTNPKCAEKLYDKVIAYTREAAGEETIIMDLFCGTGTITQLLAKGTRGKVVGVDIVESAIADARRNAERNKIKNIEFFVADVGHFLPDHPEFSGKISTLVLDPPRGGIAPKTLRKVLGLNVPHIVYVSCNPATQARDAETLINNGYVLEKVSFVDQFPHTAHIESVALFSKK
ncbi:MAG: 23S rRNA (uracil(1939)-C(5))-methyltransferase RlmD [Crocinitomicaceae bacterium]|nr:23S rRNA (uracil(1939)-C(5))-methyltransferase RlmD [Crocinitomicaceae bacterium]